MPANTILSKSNLEAKKEGKESSSDPSTAHRALPCQTFSKSIGRFCYMQYLSCLQTFVLTFKQKSDVQTTVLSWFRKDCMPQHQDTVLTHKCLRSRVSQFSPHIETISWGNRALKKWTQASSADPSIPPIALKRYKHLKPVIPTLQSHAIPFSILSPISRDISDLQVYLSMLCKDQVSLTPERFLFPAVSMVQHLIVSIRSKPLTLKARCFTYRTVSHIYQMAIPAEFPANLKLSSLPENFSEFKSQLVKLRSRIAKDSMRSEQNRRENSKWQTNRPAKENREKNRNGKGEEAREEEKDKS